MPKTRLVPWMPFALDNDAFSAWTSGEPWNVEAWRAMLSKLHSANRRPLWALVPDVVADREATLEKWNEFAPEVKRLQWPLAFALQDGMSPADVPADADVVFVGGTTEWKWKSLPMWVDHFPRVHVGRVNSIERLWTLERLGVESCDGTGWFRDGSGGRKEQMLEAWLFKKNPQPEFAISTQ